MNYNTNPPTPTALPAPYFYSDYGVGLLGLLIAASEAPLEDRDVSRWYSQVKTRILAPLGMGDTFLKVPAAKAGRLSGGYDPAIAVAEVSNGTISGITMVARGGLYSKPPRVRIIGGGGTGARAIARLAGDGVGRIDVTTGGSGYVAPVRVFFANGGSSEEAEAHAIVRSGKLVAIAVTGGGTGYQNVPDVRITGGRVGGRKAAATAHLVNGRVSFVSVDDPGAGYVDPLTVLIAPGGAIENAVPVWAPAGALTTSLKDMARFARAAMPSQKPHLGDGVGDGFRIAERAYACTGADPALSACLPQSMRSGLSWAVQPQDATARVPKVVSKDGGLPGFSTYVVLMPSRKLGVVVFANARQTLVNPPHTPTAVAAKVANNILYALFYESQLRGVGQR